MATKKKAKAPAKTKANAKKAPAKKPGRNASAGPITKRPRGEEAPAKKKVAQAMVDEISADDAILAAKNIASGWAPLSDVERAALVGRWTDAQCDELGTKTQSHAVLADGVRFIRLIDHDLRAHYPELRGYTPQQLVALCGLVVDLATARHAQDLAEGKASTIHKSAASARTDAMATREGLSQMLERLTEGDAKGSNAVAEAHGAVTDAASIAGSLLALARIAEEWLDRADTMTKFLVAQVGLTTGDVDAARAMAKSLSSSAADARTTIPTAVRDSAEVNRFEGRLLRMMRDARNVFELAHKKNKLISRLIPGRGTEVVLGGRPFTKPANPRTPSAPASPPAG